MCWQAWPGRAEQGQSAPTQLAIPVGVDLVPFAWACTQLVTWVPSHVLQGGQLAFGLGLIEIAL